MVLGVENTDVDLDVRVSRLREDGVHTDPFTVNRTDTVTPIPAVGFVYQTRTNQGSDDWTDNPDIYGHPPYCVRAKLTAGSELLVFIESAIKVIQAPPLSGVSIPTEPPFDYTGIYAFEVDTSIVGATPSDSISITFPGSNQGFDVDWGDGTTESFVLDNTVTSIGHQYSTPGIYEVRVSGLFKTVRWSLTNDKKKLIRVINTGIAFNNYTNTYSGCTNLISFEGDVAGNIAPSFSSAFRNTGLTTAPVGLFNEQAINLINALRLSPISEVPAGYFDSLVGAVRFRETFKDCDLTQQSVDNVLLSLDGNPNINSSGDPNSIDLTGGTSAAPSAAGMAAMASLMVKGWTVLTN